MPLSHAQRKAITVLHRKKGRVAQGQFLVEGVKSVADLLASPWKVHSLFATEAWKAPLDLQVPLIRVTDEELQRVSTLEKAQHVLAVGILPTSTSPSLPDQGRILALDGVQDPGNLGTLIRIADWFGVDAVVCSLDCADCFNPKVVQATMGSLFRVPVFHTDLVAYLKHLPTAFFRAGAFTQGDNLFQTSLPAHGVLVLGNEGQGIRPETEQRLNLKVTIPRLGRAESLNVATAAAVICSEWTRGQLLVS